MNVFDSQRNVNTFMAVIYPKYYFLSCCNRVELNRTLSNSSSKSIKKFRFELELKLDSTIIEPNSTNSSLII